MLKCTGNKGLSLQIPLIGEDLHRAVDRTSEVFPSVIVAGIRGLDVSRDMFIEPVQ